MRLDPALGIVIGLLVLWSSVGILRESGHILLEGLPKEMELAQVATVILRVPGVQEVHDVHVWTLGTDTHALSCHVRIPDMHMEESEKILTGFVRGSGKSSEYTTPPFSSSERACPSPASTCPNPSEPQSNENSSIQPRQHLTHSERLSLFNCALRIIRTQLA